jgi:hypothetical protein
MVKTRIVLGCRDTPRFVSKEFFDAMQLTTRTFQTDVIIRPDTIRYYIPEHFIAKTWQGNWGSFSIDLDDANLTPLCRKRTILSSHKYKHKIPRAAFDRFIVTTEQQSYKHFLLLPNARYIHTVIYKDWNTSILLYGGFFWEVHFRKVYTDPHDTSHNIWFFSQPKYHIEICTWQDFRGREADLKKAIIAILPRAFRWE